ncbi:MAG: coproporphyrinogen III oxidase, partial [Alphaproteobacteria bacterium]|nr:coproporphyrinogen III oxidase [Alphaproteobacteria bacterium]
QWCDEYFYLKHRQESRGVGGIFFDYLNSGDQAKDLAFIQSVGAAFLGIYPALVERHRDEPWTAEDLQHQTRKRSRYVEFNLLYDRGTAFGLKTGGNVEAILMSLPPTAGWE